MKTVLFYILFALLYVPSLFAQTDSEKPFWAKENYRLDLEKSYIETVVVVTEVTTDAMRQKAKEILAEKRRLTTGERVSFSENETRSQSGLTLAAKTLAEYIDYTNNVGYFLMQTLKNPSYQYETVSITNQYPFSARVFVPGMAQIHKGSIGKGVGFIVGEVVCVGGIIVAENLRATAASKINTTHNATQRNDYINQANTWGTVRNVAIGAAAAVYVWNVIDGIVAKGKKHIQIGAADLRIMPYAAPQAGGVYLSLNF